MPLSEEELRLLEQMERALVAEDPKFASTLRGTRMRQHARRQMALGVLVFLAGIALLMTGAIYKTYPVAVLGFVVMLGSAYFTLVTWRGQSRAALQADQRQQHPSAGGDQPLRVIDGGKVRRARGGRPPKAAKPPKSQGSMMERFEERWRRRREQNGGF